MTSDIAFLTWPSMTHLVMPPPQSNLQYKHPHTHIGISLVSHKRISKSFTNHEKRNNENLDYKLVRFHHRIMIRSCKECKECHCDETVRNSFERQYPSHPLIFKQKSDWTISLIKNYDITDKTTRTSGQTRQFCVVPQGLSTNLIGSNHLESRIQNLESDWCTKKFNHHF